MTTGRLTSGGCATRAANPNCGILIRQGGIMERFEDVIGFFVVGLLPLTLCGAAYIAELLGQ